MSDSNNFFSNSYDSSSYNKPTEYFEVLDKWFASDMYTTVENDAFLGCGNSVEFLKEFEMHLDSAHFHLKNNSSRSRIDYDLCQMANLVKSFIE